MRVVNISLPNMFTECPPAKSDIKLFHETDVQAYI